MHCADVRCAEIFDQICTPTMTLQNTVGFPHSQIHETDLVALPGTRRAGPWQQILSLRECVFLASLCTPTIIMRHLVHLENVCWSGNGVSFSFNDGPSGNQCIDLQGSGRLTETG